MSFPTYENYSESGVQWVGDVPSHWAIVPLKRLVDIQNGADYKHVEQDDGYPVIGSGGPFTYASDYLFDGESVLLGRKGTVDKPLYVTGRFWTVDTMYWSKICPGVSGRFAYYTATTIPFAYYTTSTALPSMTKGALNGHLVALPPLAEQRAIVAFLDHETAKIDALIAELRRLLSLTKERISSAVLLAFHDPESREMRLSQAASAVSRPVLQREGELYEPLGLLNRGRGAFHKEPRATAEMGDSDFFWVQSGDLILSGQFAWEGAVALAADAEANCVVSHRYPILRGRDDVATTDYLFALLLTRHGDHLLNEHSRGSAGRNRPLNIRSLLKEKVWIGSRGVQAQVGEAVHTYLAAAQEVEALEKLLEERRAALIYAAVTGKIDVRGLVEDQAEAA